MTIRERTLFAGEVVRVPFGGFGHQVAVVVTDCKAHETHARVQKYRERSGRWTQPVRVLRSSLEPATEADRALVKERLRQ